MTHYYWCTMTAKWKDIKHRPPVAEPNPDSHRDPREGAARLLGDHLQANAARRHGRQTSGLVQCLKHQEFYPSTETCPYCEPSPAVRTMGRQCYDAMVGLGDHGWAQVDQAMWEQYGWHEWQMRGHAQFNKDFP